MATHSVITLYHNLMKLCEKNEAFYWKDSTSVGGGIFRTVAYRLASYSDFLEPDALECRGIMFEVRPDGSMIRVACRTPQKFFNAYENPFVMFPKDMLSTEIVLAMDKRDGSIISTFRDNDEVIRTKSHTSMHSDHAINSTALIHADDELHQAIIEADTAMYTVNLEYTSPEFRIVLPYQKDELTVLNLRHRQTGDLLVGEALKKRFPVLYKKSVFSMNGDIDKSFPMCHTLKDSINAVYGMTDIEGFVVQLKDGTMFKIKTEWYCALHFTKDSINVDSRLYEAVLQGGSDDLKQLFATDQYCLDKIARMEQLVFSTYNHLQTEVQEFVDANKHLDRKEFALTVQRDLPNELNRQGLAFSLYNKKAVDYKEVMLKYMKNVLENF
ncbi:T4 RnlA family RNA ligase [Salmonella enterica]